jgi:hypothetical protein
LGIAGANGVQPIREDAAVGSPPLVVVSNQGLLFISALGNVQNPDIRGEDPDVILRYVALDIRGGPTG